MSQYWGDITGQRSCLTTIRLAKRLRLAGMGGVGATAAVTKLLTTMDGDRAEFTADEARHIVYALRCTASRMWFTTPGWRRLARMIANDADRAAVRNQTWVVQ